MATVPSLVSTVLFNIQNPNKTLTKTTSFNFKSNHFFNSICFSPSRSHFLSKNRIFFNRFVCPLSSNTLSTISVETRNYEFSDGAAEVELRLNLGGREIQNSKDVFVDINENSLTVRVRSSGTFITLMEISQLYEKIKPAETIWYLDEEELVLNLKKHDKDLKWPDIVECWESLTTGVTQLLKGASIYIVGDSKEFNQKVAKELAVGLGYTPLNTSELLETFAQQTIDSWVTAEGAESVAEAEGAILESLSSHVRTVVATLGGNHGAAGRSNKWRHLHSGFTVWLSQSEATDETSAKEEARRDKYGNQAYSNADVVVKLGGWDSGLAQTVAQGCLSALKQLILSDKQLPGLVHSPCCTSGLKTIVPFGYSIKWCELIKVTLMNLTIFTSSLSNTAHPYFHQACETAKLRLKIQCETTTEDSMFRETGKRLLHQKEINLNTRGCL